MLVLRVAAVAAVTGLMGAAGVGCASTVVGTGSLAQGVPTHAPTRTGSPATPLAGASTVDPVLGREQLACVLVAKVVKATNDAFNRTASRSTQISVLRTGAAEVATALQRAQLPSTDRIYALGGTVLAEMRKLVAGAERGGTPSTAPYNRAIDRFHSACGDI